MNRPLLRNELTFPLNEEEQPAVSETNMGCTVTRYKPAGNSDNLIREQKNTVAAKEISSERIVKAEIRVILEQEHNEPAPRTVRVARVKEIEVCTQGKRTVADFSWLSSK